MLFLDSSEPHEIREISSWGVIAGVTTNPLILAREAGNVDLEQRVRSLVEVAPGPVSVELTSDGLDAMLREADMYHGWGPDKVCIKVPMSEVGLRVIHTLAKRGVATNATCMMSFAQLYVAALAGARYVSLFAGRVRDMGYDAGAIVRETRAVLDREKLPCEIIVGSIRQSYDVSEALQHGAHIVTVPPGLLRKMLWNPRTESTIAEFNEAWEKRGQ